MSMFIGWLFFSVAAAMFAHIRRNRNGAGWFFVALLFTPLVAFVLLAILRPLPEEHPLTLVELEMAAPAHNGRTINIVMAVCFSSVFALMGLFAIVVYFS